MPIHERCHCGVLPIAGGKDPGRSLNQDEFKTIYGEAGSTSREDLAKVRVEVHQHGELGPVLRLKDQNFRGPAEVKKPMSLFERAHGPNAEKTPVVVKPLTPAERLARDREALARTRANTPKPVRKAAPAKAAPAKAAPAKAAPAKAVSDINSPEAIAARRAARQGKAAPAPGVKAPLPPTPRINALPRKTGVAGGLEDVKKTNPGFGKPGYNINCVHVVNTYEMRRRGYSVQATALPQAMRKAQGRDPFEAIKRWRNADGSPVRDTAFRSARDSTGIQSLVNTLPPGGRGWVILRWKDGGGHIMNVEKGADGRLRWLEAQEGKEINPSAYLRRGVSFNFARVDNLVPTDAVMEFMEPGRG